MIQAAHPKETRPGGNPGPLARRLRDARRRHGHSQRQAAIAMGVPTNTFQTWEQGRRMPTVVAYVKAVERYLQDGRET